MGLDRRGCVVQPRPRAKWRREEPVDKVKPFEIWQRIVRENRGPDQRAPVIFRATTERER